MEITRIAAMSNTAVVTFLILSNCLDLACIYSPLELRLCYTSATWVNRISIAYSIGRKAMIATIINALCVIVGSIIGLILRKGIKDRYQKVI